MSRVKVERQWRSVELSGTAGGNLASDCGGFLLFQITSMTETKEKDRSKREERKMEMQKIEEAKRQKEGKKI